MSMNSYSLWYSHLPPNTSVDDHTHPTVLDEEYKPSPREDTAGRL